MENKGKSIHRCFQFLESKKLLELLNLYNDFLGWTSLYVFYPYIISFLCSGGKNSTINHCNIIIN